MPRTSRIVAGLLIASALSVSAARAQSTLRAGTEFQVNSYTTGNQQRPALAALPDGSYFLVWESEFQDGSGYGVYGRRLSRTGAFLGAEFQVAQSTLSSQLRASVAADPYGRITVAWTGVDSSAGGIYARQFSTAGPLGPEFLVNTYAPGEQVAPKVSAGLGGMAIVWQSLDQDGAGWGVYGRLYTPTGTPVTGEVPLSSSTAFDQTEPSVAALDNGHFATTWLSASANPPHVMTRLFDAGFAPLTSETTAPEGGNSRRDYPSVVNGGAGTYWVGLWEAFFIGGKDIAQSTDLGVSFQRYDVSGAPVGPRSTVAAGGIGSDARFQGVASMNAAGGLMVAYTSAPGILFCFNFPPFPDNCPPDLPEDGSGASVWMGAVGAGTDPSRVRLNVFSAGDQQFPAVAQDIYGNGLIAWQSPQDGNATGIYAQRMGGLFPVSIVADPAGNGVLDPGVPETVRPTWENQNGAAVTAGGSIFGFVGPAGGTYAITDGTASYGSIANGATQACTDCYQLTASFPGGRPAVHVDSYVGESLTPPPVSVHKIWTLHVGGSFADVLSTSPYYRFIETMLHNGVSTGCGGNNFCPTTDTTRDLMALWVLLSKEGAGYVPPACTTPMFADVPASNPFCRYIEELARRGVVAGCGGGNYCPTSAVLREQMAVFVSTTFGLRLY